MNMAGIGGVFRQSRFQEQKLPHRGRTDDIVSRVMDDVSGGYGDIPPGPLDGTQGYRRAENSLRIGERRGRRPHLLDGREVGQGPVAILVPDSVTELRVARNARVDEGIDVRDGLGDIPHGSGLFKELDVTAGEGS